MYAYMGELIIYTCMHIYVYDKVVHDITEDFKGIHCKLLYDTSNKMYSNKGKSNSNMVYFVMRGCFLVRLKIFAKIGKVV